VNVKLTLLDVLTKSFDSGYKFFIHNSPLFRYGKISA